MLKIEYINFEVEVEAESIEDEEEIVFSDKENESLIYDSNCNNIQYPSFYRFVNQWCDPVEAVEDDDESRLDRYEIFDTIKMFHNIEREQVEFYDFDDNQEWTNRFKKIFCSFEESNFQDSFFKPFYNVFFSS